MPAKTLPLLLVLPLAAALALPAAAAPRKWRPVAPPDPYADEEYFDGGLEPLPAGRDPYAYARPYGRLPAGSFWEEPALRPVYGTAAGLPPSYAFEPETEALGMAVDPAFMRAVVPYSGRHAPGTIVIDTPHKYLYLVEPGGIAIRYGIGVGRPGFTWSGLKTVSNEARMARMAPARRHARRRPDLPRYMEGGPDNPLGARALYLGSSLYRIHGTNEPHTIGHNVSSGCIRMMNRTSSTSTGGCRVGTKVVVI